MVFGSHVILSMYGFWLPNDPRGSWSDFAGAWELFWFGGPATRTDERHSVAGRPHNRRARLQTKEHLKYPPVSLTGVQALAVGAGFGRRSQKGKITIWACSVLPEHVHLVVARHRLSAESIANQMKGAATTRLIEEKIHPLAHFVAADERPPAVFARGEWKVYLDSEADILRAIQYVEDNPVREGLPRQRWSFVTQFDASAPPFGSRPETRSPSGRG